MATVTATITRTELGLPDLSLIDPGTYEIPAGGLRPGAVPNELETATSPYVSGALLVARRKALVPASIVVDVEATTHAALRDRVAAIRSAFDQRSYQLSAVLDGTAWTWSCLPFTSFEAPTFASPQFEAGFIAQVAIAFSRQPVPIAGPL